MTALRGADVLVTGGAGTIGSTLVDQLIDAGVAHIDVLDNLVRGRRENLASAFDSGKVALVVGDLRDRDLVHDLTKGRMSSVIKRRSASPSARRSRGLRLRCSSTARSPCSRPQWPRT